MNIFIDLQPNSALKVPKQERTCGNKGESSRTNNTKSLEFNKGGKSTGKENHTKQKLQTKTMFIFAINRDKRERFRWALLPERSFFKELQNEPCCSKLPLELLSIKPRTRQIPKEDEKDATDALRGLTAAARWQRRPAARICKDENAKTSQTAFFSFY